MSPNCSQCPYNRKDVKNRHRVGARFKSIPKPGQRRSETGCQWECLKSVEQILRKRHKKIAAGIIEPIIQGASGMVVMPPGYVAGFRRLLSKYKVLMISDEVATGFGRTGTLFAGDQEYAIPDILCIAKALTGGYAPLAATLTRESVYKAFWGTVNQNRTFFHGHSYTGHPLGAAVALANLKLIRNTKLLEKTRHKAHLMREELNALNGLSGINSIRQAGLMVGLELKSPRAARKVCKMLLNQGVWLRPLGPTVVIMPPPVITEADLKRLMRRVGSVIRHECQTE